MEGTGEDPLIMKVLLVHNFYQSSSPSGEDMVYRNEAELLRKNAIEVVRYEKHNDDISGRFSASASAVWSGQTYHELLSIIRKEKPDIAHFHNIWYLISPSAYYACKDAGVPVVQTLHNFRMFCANGLLMRSGKVCEECAGSMPLKSILHGCYRNSRIFSLPVAVSEIYHRLKKTWTEQVDAYIALTGFGKIKFVECGLPEEKIFIKPNFIPDPPAPVYTDSGYGVFLGRLSKEKGINVLLDALRTMKETWDINLPVKIIGDGPLMSELKKNIENLNLRNVELSGRKSHTECMDLLKRASLLVMPSVCYENFPMSIVEAFAFGKPVVASRLGVMADIIEERKTGLLFDPGDPLDLAEKIRWMNEDKDVCMVMGRNARSVFEEKYTADRNIATLKHIYQETIKSRK